MPNKRLELLPDVWQPHRFTEKVSLFLCIDGNAWISRKRSLSEPRFRRVIRVLDAKRSFGERGAGDL